MAIQQATFGQRYWPTLPPKLPLPSSIDCMGTSYPGTFYTLCFLPCVSLQFLLAGKLPSHFTPNVSWCITNLQAAKIIILNGAVLDKTNSQQSSVISIHLLSGVNLMGGEGGWYPTCNTQEALLPIDYPLGRRFLLWFSMISQNSSLLL